MTLEGSVEIELKISVRDALLDWIVSQRKALQISLDEGYAAVSDGTNGVLIRYEVRGDKVVLKSLVK
ncbi:hypothetical protein Tneu_1487 [Pyrobaculum neutrophilum V24Sta]|uniref:Uncharacterized protein n=1 Tax=Pyrobaculum neutrophilum (strain DSM 2338 / JCM 9278 / NBRC 100436 / V24Sta) TaxID=444157 RepID=B1Y9I2_PYRNV|nr:hypothetical protein Tneu_1487 [Pyrobaculum neutrophilum V24Sta]